MSEASSGIPPASSQTASSKAFDNLTPEHQRLAQANARTAHWKRWGPYLAERAWGTVREDYSDDPNKVWASLPHDHARSKAYRWNEDGIAGICDRHQRTCFALAFWNENDPILKERLFGLNGDEGNHGEDVKECYYYLDSTPTHSYMKHLYKYPQADFPYQHLTQENQRRNRTQREYELLDTGIFESPYFDVPFYAEQSARADAGPVVSGALQKRGARGLGYTPGFKLRPNSAGKQVRLIRSLELQ